MSVITKPRPTYEQATAIDNARLGKSFKVIAYAGTGKTTTLQMISDAMPERRGMYLAFNKAIASEAQQKFHRNVDSRTFHSLAYRSVPRNITDKLRLPRLSPSFLAKEYRLEPITLRRLMGGRYEKYALMPSRLASIVVNAVGYFCATSSQYPAPRHIQVPSWLHPDDIDALQKHLYPAVERRWLESIDPNHQAGIGHDIYLKLWALSEPNIPADYVLFDEAQDADPLMLGILLALIGTVITFKATASLYGILKQLNSPSIKTMTIEDPIEFRIQGIVQAATNLKLTFAKALRAMLRQDPDVILVGEIRDAETAGLATQAALTGHIVLSTLHANSATVTLNRMLDLEVDPNALSAALGGFLAQRLVRTLCPHCKHPQPLDGYIRRQIKEAGVSEEESDAIGVIYRENPEGCDHCHEGWSGRTPVFEIILATPDVRIAVERGDLAALKAAALLQPQYRTLSHDAYRLVALGVTSVSEAMAVTGSSMIVSDD